MTAPLILQSSDLHATIERRGARLTALRLGPGGRNLVLSPPGSDHPAWDQTFAGAIVGPVANRIAGGDLRIGSEAFQMPRNEAGRHSLHSGSDGLHARDWTVADTDKDRATLEITLSDGEGGLPGNRRIRAHYRVTGLVLHLTIDAVTDRTTAMNPAPHAYWNLEPAGDVSDHLLQIVADHYLPTDAENLPTGQIAPVAGTPFDFRTPTRLGRDAALDVNYCLGQKPAAAPRHAATLTGASGLGLTVHTTAPGLQVYSGAHLPDLPGGREGGGDIGPFAGIALEPQFWPDAPRHPAFPSILLQPAHVWRQETEFHLHPPR